MNALPLNRHALLAALLCAATLLAGCLAVGGSAVRASAASADPRVPDEQGAAPDARFPAGGPSMALARQVAEAHWGAAPCGGEVEVRWSVLEAGTNATASWRNPTDAWANAAANFDCAIDFNPRADYDWPKLCTVMAHEVGHLLGRQHVAAADDVMAPLYTEPLPACEQAADPAAPPPAAAPEELPEESAEAVAAAPTAAAAAKRRAAAARRRAARCRVAKRMGLSTKRLRCAVSRSARHR